MAILLRGMYRGEWRPRANRLHHWDARSRRRPGDPSAPGHRWGWSPCTDRLGHYRDARRGRELPNLRTRQGLAGFTVRGMGRLVELRHDRGHRRHVAAQAATDLCLHIRRPLLVALSCNLVHRPEVGRAADEAKPGEYGSGLAALARHVRSLPPRRERARDVPRRGKPAKLTMRTPASRLLAPGLRII